MELATLIAKKLLEVNAIKLRPDDPFTWASGMKSPIYCDNRIALSYPEIRSFIKNELSLLANSFGSFDTVAGVATAGIPMGALIADKLEKSFVYVRSKSKDHGRQNLIEGHLNPEASVIVVEDLISTGKSSLNAVEAIRAAGGNVKAVIAIFDYGFPIAKKAFEDAQCPFKTLSNYHALLQQAVTQHYITAKEETILKIWNQDPDYWAKNLI